MWCDRFQGYELHGSRATATSGSTVHVQGLQAQGPRTNAADCWLAPALPPLPGSYGIGVHSRQWEQPRLKCNIATTVFKACESAAE